MKRYYVLTTKVLIDDADDVSYIEEQLTDHANRMDEIDDSISVLDVQITLEDVK